MTSPPHTARDGESRQSAAGQMLRSWRARRRLSQLELGLAAGVSARHVSFVETGRAGASRELLIALGEQLDVPLRERNALLLAAGYAPSYTESDLGQPALAGVHGALDELLTAYEPYPALVVNRWGEVAMSNQAVGALLAEVDPSMLAPPINIYRLSLHPDGLAPAVRNLAQWAQHLMHRLQRLAQVTADSRITELLTEVRRYPLPDQPQPDHNPAGDVLLPLHLAHPAGELRLHSAMTTFGAPHDVTLAELALESFLPADDHSRQLLHELAQQPLAGPATVELSASER